MTSRTAFAIPAFRRLWGAGLISDMGDWLLFIAMPLIVFQLTGSALGTAIAFLLELVPAVLLAPLAARLVGRFDRRWLMVAVNIGQALALLPLLWVNDAADLPIAYAVIVVHASLSTLFEPAKNTLLPDLVDVERLVSANALIGLNQNLGRLIGGPLGGVLLAVGDLGLIVVVDAATYLLSAILIATLPKATPASLSTDPDRPPGGLWEALRIRRLLGAYAVIVITSIAQGMFLLLFVLFALGPLQGSDADVGLLRGIQAVGAIIAGLVLGFLVRGSSPRALTAASVLAFGVISLVTWNLPALTTGLGWYVVLFAAVGAPGVIMFAGLMSVLQQESEPRQRGAVFAAVGLASAVGQGLGILLGALSDTAFGLLPLLQVQGCLYLLGGLIALLWLPRALGSARARDADAVARM
ncbi:MFS transporter [Agrococcus sp. ARC_14]|uniref:MFS transporter n=1 Tax=Agrococcus sp. ARC_14 TaxID=2919927 RepID=UPI001F05E6EC|nr:MFS transporter [Agrococcus sp. ARC_14]MCH1882767.1 MFS transporter [Agrococcus sp. ARC_14]